MVSYKTLTDTQRIEYAQKSKMETIKKEELWKKRNPVKPTVSHCVKDGTGALFNQ